MGAENYSLKINKNEILFKEREQTTLRDLKSEPYFLRVCLQK